MSAEHPPDAAPAPKHPFSQAWETWEAWSMANTMRTALRKARQQGDRDSLASFEQYPEWTTGPGPLEALRANRELVRDLAGWQWQAVREAREQGHGWAEIGHALEVDAEQARRDYLERVERQRLVASRSPEVARLIGYDPRWRELADDNAADRAHQHARARDDRGEGVGDRER